MDTEKLYFDGGGKHQDTYRKLWDALVPARGDAETEAGQLLRIMSKFYYDWYNNGNCNATHVTYETNYCGEEDEEEERIFEVDPWYAEEAEKFIEICETHEGRVFEAARDAMDIILSKLDEDQEWRWKYHQDEANAEYEKLADTAILAAQALHESDI